MVKWHEKLKLYPHFDKHIGVEEIESLVSDPKNVSKNQFLPFIRNTKIEPKFNAARADWKQREIYWSARRDAYIYTYYREKISIFYEDSLQKNNIKEVAIAYRKIPKTKNGDYGKSSIDFAIDAFSKICEFKNCTAIAMDIKGFFDNLSHDKIYTSIANLPDFDLTSDYRAILKSLTKFHYIDYIEALEALGLFGDITIDGVAKRGKLIGKKAIRANQNQICSWTDFREKICGQGGKYPKLIKENPRGKRGIPQGTPISDIIANIYMIEFDIAFTTFCNQHRIYYRRYSDDILLIVPKDSISTAKVEIELKKALALHCDGLEIKDSKTKIVEFEETPLGIRSCGKSYFEYLGVSFNGETAMLRGSTVSRLYEKVISTATREAISAKKRYSTLSRPEIVRRKFGDVYKKFGQNCSFEFENHKSWTFWTYAKRLNQEI